MWLATTAARPHAAMTPWIIALRRQGPRVMNHDSECFSGLDHHSMGTRPIVTIALVVLSQIGENTLNIELERNMV